MVQTLQAKEITLRDLIVKFGIQLVEDEPFFWEWQDNLPELTSFDSQVLKDQLWVMVVESKKAALSIEEGLAQILAYMLGNPYPEKPSFGMITTGGSFVFVKLVKGEVPLYALSKVFITRNPGNELYEVLRILKRLSQLVNNSDENEASG